MEIKRVEGKPDPEKVPPSPWIALVVLLIALSMLVWGQQILHLADKLDKAKTHTSGASR